MRFTVGGQITFFGTTVLQPRYFVDQLACRRIAALLCRRLIFETAATFWSFEPASRFHQEVKATEFYTPLKAARLWVQACLETLVIFQQILSCR